MARSDQQKQEVRRRILRAALKIISEGGYRDAQMATVAAAAKMATGTVYLYFPSKADLCGEVFRYASSHEIAVLKDIAGLDEPAADRFESVIRTFVRRAVRGRRLAYALIAEPVDPAVEAERLQSKQVYAQVFIGIVREGIREGVFPDQDVEVAAACLIGALTEALVGPLTPEAVDAAAGEELEDAMVVFCRRAVGLRETGRGEIALSGDRR
tara:strand:+ start:696 stop:1331 length:636 start_codon:yes stop_codon:yes gene_type:complete